jgi:hypothetical protein
MPISTWLPIVERLRGVEYRFGLVTADSPSYQIEFAPGLTDLEVEATEDRFGFRFPPDLREFLQTALPCGPRFPNWRSGDVKELREWLNLPKEGILFDIEQNKFWLQEWGPCPDTMAAALDFASTLIEDAPSLIPVYGHRMMPEEPEQHGNPVLSIHQTDIIYYGVNLQQYLSCEFCGLRYGEAVEGNLPRIRFWTDFLD